MKRSPRPVLCSDAKSWRIMRADGVEIDRIAAIYDRPPQTVWNHVRDVKPADVGTRVGQGRGLRPDEQASLLEAFESGKTPASIARRFRLSATSVPVIVWRLRKARREAHLDAPPDTQPIKSEDAAP